MQTNPELPVNRRVYQTFAVPAMLLAMEADLIRRFLGDDLKDICDAAADSRFSVLISTAGLELAKREEALQVWRTDCVRSIIESSELAKIFVQDGPPDFVQSILNGDVTLAEFKDRIEDHIVGAREKESAARRKTKGDLREKLRSLIRDLNPKHPDNIEPRWMVFDAWGGKEFFRYERAAIEYGRSTGQAFYLFAFNLVGSGIKPPLAGWSAAAGAPAITGLLNEPALGMTSEEIEDMADETGVSNDETAGMADEETGE